MRETVLIIGGPESTKTGALVQVAVDNPELQCWAFDTELKIERIALFFGGLTKIPNLHIVRGESGNIATDIGDMLWGMKNQVVTAKPDVILIDMVRNITDRAREYIAEVKFPGGMPEAMSKVVGSKTGAQNPDFTAGEWNNASAMYNAIVGRALFRMDCHVFLSSASKAIIDPSVRLGSAEYLRTPENLRNVWAEYGAQPDGDKDLSFQVNTCIGLDMTGLAIRTLRMSLLKDVTRRAEESTPKFLREPVKPDFLRNAGKPNEVSVFNIWKSLNARGYGFDWPLKKQ